MASEQSRNKDRAARVEQMRKQQAAADRRRASLIWGATVAVVLLLVGAITWVVIDNRPAPLEGVQTFEDLGRDHVEGPVEYDQTPPAGGDHHAAWWNCGIYDEEIPPHHAVHSLEHGAVWLTYQSDLPADQVEELREYAGNDYMLMSPLAAQDSPVISTAWGHQLRTDTADDPRILSFIREYRQGPQTPEPGAACTGGTTVDLLTNPMPNPAPSMDEAPTQ